MIDIDNTHDLKAKIKVIGVGGGGGNAVDRMVISGILDVEFISANTDSKALARSKAAVRIQLGEQLTRGLGAGSKPEVGRKAAEETREILKNAIGEDTDLLFITAGMGGGTGTGAAPVIAALAKEMGILTVGIVTKPFSFEGKARMAKAEAGIIELKKNVDTIVVVPNDRLESIIDDDASLQDSFFIADEVLRQGVSGITGTILDDGLVNLDFADVQTIMKDKGLAHMGVGTASGKDKVMEATIAALNSPLLETSVKGAKNILIAYTGDKSLGMKAITNASNMVNEAVNPDANIIFGATLLEEPCDEVMVTIVATGIDDDIAYFGEEDDYDEYETPVEEVVIQPVRRVVQRKPASPPVRTQKTARPTRTPAPAPAPPVEYEYVYEDEYDDDQPVIRPVRTEDDDYYKDDGPEFLTIDENEGIKTPSFLREWKNNRPPNR